MLIPAGKKNHNKSTEIRTLTKIYFVDFITEGLSVLIMTKSFYIRQQCLRNIEIRMYLNSKPEALI